MDTPVNIPKHTTKRSTYALVFGVLVLLTAAEVGLTFLGMPRRLVTGLFLVMSLAKASLVAAFYMHLRDDSRLFSYIFIIPVILLAVFAVMSSLY